MKTLEFEVPVDEARSFLSKIEQYGDGGPVQIPAEGTINVKMFLSDDQAELFEDMLSVGELSPSLFARRDA